MPGAFALPCNWQLYVFRFAREHEPQPVLLGVVSVDIGRRRAGFGIRSRSALRAGAEIGVSLYLCQSDW